MTNFVGRSTWAPRSTRALRDFATVVASSIFVLVLILGAFSLASIFENSFEMVSIAPGKAFSTTSCQPFGASPKGGGGGGREARPIRGRVRWTRAFLILFGPLPQRAETLQFEMLGLCF